VKKLLFLALLLQGCGESAIKKMIIEPRPPEPVISTKACHLHLDSRATVKETAVQAMRISEYCSFNEEEFQIWAEEDLKNN